MSKKEKKNTRQRLETRRQRKKKKKQQQWNLIKMVFSTLGYIHQIAKVIEYLLKLFF